MSDQSSWKAKASAGAKNACLIVGAITIGTLPFRLARPQYRVMLDFAIDREAGGLPICLEKVQWRSVETYRLRYVDADPPWQYYHDERKQWRSVPSEARRFVDEFWDEDENPYAESQYDRPW